MRRSTLRILAFFVLAFLSAPVAMHVVMHDLHGHHDAADAQLAVIAIEPAGHGDHDHPIVASPAPQLPSLTRAAVPLVTPTATVPATWMAMTTAERNVVSLGALRMDDDVGLQPLLSTFLI